MFIASINLCHTELGQEYHILQMGKLRLRAKLCLVKCYKAVFAVQFVALVCGMLAIICKDLPSLLCSSPNIYFETCQRISQWQNQSFLSITSKLAVDLVFLTRHSSYW